MTNNYNKLTKAELINLLKETEAKLQAKQTYYATLDEQLITIKDEYKSLQSAYASLHQHATKQNTEIKELKAQQTQQTYTLIINNDHWYHFNSKEDCHTWIKRVLYSYKLLKTINTPTSVILFIMAESKARHGKRAIY